MKYVSDIIIFKQHPIIYTSAEASSRAREYVGALEVQKLILHAWRTWVVMESRVQACSSRTRICKTRSLLEMYKLGDHFYAGA